MKYNAVAFLENLFQSQVEGEDEPVPDAPNLTPADLPPEWHLLWDERAAIMEYDGKIPKERAEALALDDVLKRMERVRLHRLRII